MIDKDLTEQLMSAVRVKSEVAREEIGELAIACKKNWRLPGFM